MTKHLLRMGDMFDDTSRMKTVKAVMGYQHAVRMKYDKCKHIMDEQTYLLALHMLTYHDIVTSSDEKTLHPKMLMVETKSHKLYRLSIEDDKSINILHFDMIDLDNDISGHYSGVDDLPDWAASQLALLMMVNPTPPTRYVDGVGRRISDSIFWIEAKS
jgi:hypothetical protein